jgi:ribosome-binding factor A
MSKIRVGRVSEQIKKELSQIIQAEMKDPRIRFLTVTAVETTNDLSMSKVYLSIMGTEDEKQATLQALASGRGYIRTELAKRIRLRITPELQFVMDASMDYSERIEQLLIQIHKNGPTQP